MAIEETGNGSSEHTHELTRTQVAAQLGISVSAVRRREGEDLHPVQDEKGVWRFDASEVVRLARAERRRSGARSRGRRQKSGEVAARVFRLLEQGRELHEIVIQVRERPERIRKLYREWLTGLADGEQLRRRTEERDQQRRESLEDERMQLEQLRILCRDPRPRR